jgi:7-keto-8-aminopelargonate synthetase-like enzyme
MISSNAVLFTCFLVVDFAMLVSGFLIGRNLGSTANRFPPTVRSTSASIVLATFGALGAIGAFISSILIVAAYFLTPR